jgi:sorbitol/mannitol transport system substrate-binding protein
VAGATDLTIAIVNNGHMINMQKVAEAYTAETGVSLNWVSLEEGVLREQVTSDTATGGGQYDIINIGMQEAPIWGAAGWIEPLNFGSEYDMDDILPAIRAGLSHEGTMYAAPFYGESSMVMYRKDLTDAAGVVVVIMTHGQILKALQQQCMTLIMVYMALVCGVNQAGVIIWLSSQQS